MLGRRVSAYGHGGNGSEPKARPETSFMVLVSKARNPQRCRSSGLEVSKWSHGSDSNRRPAVYETAALPAELPWRTGQFLTAYLQDST